MFVEKIQRKIHDLDELTESLRTKQQPDSTTFKELIKLSVALKILELNINQYDTRINYHGIDENIKIIDSHLRNLRSLLIKKDYVMLASKINSIKMYIKFKKFFYNIAQFILSFI